MKKLKVTRAVGFLFLFFNMVISQTRSFFLLHFALNQMFTSWYTSCFLGGKLPDTDHSCIRSQTLNKSSWTHLGGLVKHSWTTTHPSPPSVFESVGLDEVWDCLSYKFPGDADLGTIL